MCKAHCDVYHTRFDNKRILPVHTQTRTLLLTRLYNSCPHSPTKPGNCLASHNLRRAHEQIFLHHLPEELLIVIGTLVLIQGLLRGVSRLALVGRLANEERVDSPFEHGELDAFFSLCFVQVELQCPWLVLANPLDRFCGDLFELELLLVSEPPGRTQEEHHHLLVPPFQVLVLRWQQWLFGLMPFSLA